MFSYHNSTKELVDAGVDTAILSVGSTEQCGPCLPFHLDTLMVEYFAAAWGDALNAYVLPTLPFNTAEEHSSFKGTITLRPQTVMTVLEEMVQVLAKQGFCKQVLTVGHGGSWWMGAFIKDINWRYDELILINGHSGADPIWARALDHAGLPDDAIHGGAVSRALASYLAPDDVQAGAFGTDIGVEMQELNGYVTWEKITPDGSWGRYADVDQGADMAERGQKLLTYFTQHQSENLKQHVVEACRLKGIE